MNKGLQHCITYT